jgi:hypothetical protein
MLFIWLGALLVIGGALYLVKQAIWQGPLSVLGRRRAQAPRDTLEPLPRGDSVFGLARNWPGLALMALGAILLLAGAAI